MLLGEIVQLGNARLRLGDEQLNSPLVLFGIGVTNEMRHCLKNQLRETCETCVSGRSIAMNCFTYLWSVYTAYSVINL